MTSPGGLAVSGGVGGHGAELDDLDHAAARLRSSAAELEQASAEVGRGRSLLQGLDGVLAEPVAVLALESELVGVHRELERLAESTGGLSQLVVACATGYRTAEEASRNRWAALGALVGVAFPVLPAAGWLLTSAAPSLLQLVPDDDGGPPPSAPERDLSGWLPDTADPQLGAGPAGLAGAVPPLPGEVAPAAAAPPGRAAPAAAADAGPQPDALTVVGRLVGPGEEQLVGLLAGSLVGAAALVAPAGPLLTARAAAAGGRSGPGSTTTVVTPSPVPPAVAAAGPPTGVGDVLRRVGDTGDGAGPPGRVRVERVVHADGSRAAVVYLPGTQSWASGSDLPASVDAVLRGVAGQPSAYSDAVVRAMEEAGVEHDEPVMLAGYSLGGITAAQMAADPAVQARFHVEALVTAGSPVGQVDLPAGVESLSLEHTEDLVPRLDGAENTALSVDRVTVTAPTPGQLGAHQLEGYTALADAVDASDDSSLTAHREAVGEFFARPGDTSEVTEVVARRTGPGIALP